MSSLPRVRPGMLRHRLEEQSLVYDPREDKVHLLDPTTACILDLLEEGGWSRERMKTEVSRRLNIDATDEVIALSLDELRKADVIETAEPVVSDMARRDMLRKIGIVGATALAVPIITTLTATPAYAVCTGRLPQGSACVAGSQCCSGACGSRRCT
ncbi:MAG TPA: hypothetical protein VM099_06100 [Gemmatimonadaceae bacterium]|nr:hypothetical protein [Gemmatimonadaceae bacterium]